MKSGERPTVDLVRTVKCYQHVVEKCGLPPPGYEYGETSCYPLLKAWLTVTTV